jgi:hypothetical protein
MLHQDVIDEIVRRVLDGLRTKDAVGLIDQSKSPLGRRRHIALARKDGTQVGRRYFLTPEQVQTALAEMTAKRRAVRDDDVDAVLGLKTA